MRILALASLLLSLSATPAYAHDGALKCEMCQQWNQRQQPFNIHGNTWYVGTTELSAVLVTGPEGHVLLDAALPQSAPLIAASIRELGFRVEDVKLILNSHEHYDHAGGIPAMQKLTGAEVAASAAGAKVLQAGTVGPDDPQYHAAAPVVLPGVAKVRVVRDGETVRVGPLALTAHMTPGHTPGGTTWSWRSCAGASCMDVVYADSLNPVSMDHYRFGGGAGQPDRSAAFRATIAKVAALPCDIVVSVHPGFTDTLGKWARKSFVEQGGCKRYAADAGARLDKRLARERTAPGG